VEEKKPAEEPETLDELLDSELMEEEEKPEEKPAESSKKEEPEELGDLLDEEEETPKEEASVGKEKSGLENVELLDEAPSGGEEEIKPQGPIILQFEDDFEEVRELLHEDAATAREKVKEELQKASMELGIPEDLGAELFKELIGQIMGERDHFQKIIKHRDYEELHKTAHKLKGAALNLRLSQIALILKMIDEYSKRREPIETIAELVNSFYQFMEKVKDVDQVLGGAAPASTATPTPEPAPAPKEEPKAAEPEKKEEAPAPKPRLTRVIIKTIRKYLEIGDEEKFQKDKKHIEKLLKTKLNSLEDLRKFIGE
jgi:HPt (histidine-containing phosphotransfer) domain-containing protein